MRKLPIGFRLGLAVGIVIVSIAYLALWYSVGNTQATAVVEVQKITLTPGASGTISVSVKNVVAPTGLAAYSFAISFDPKVVLVENVLPGDPPFTAAPTQNVNNATGQVRILAVLSTLQGATGSLTVAKLAVRASPTAALGASTAMTLTLAQEGLIDAQGNTIPASVTNGAVQVASPLSADFAPSSNVVDAGQPVQFTDTSSGSPTSWLWDFGDGSTSTVQSPSKTYTKIGAYQVKLTVGNTVGSNTKTGSVVVEPSKLSTVTVTPNVVDLGPGKIQFFSATGKDEYGNEISGLSLSWSVVSGGGSIDSSGAFTAGTIGGTFSNTVSAAAFYKGSSATGYASVRVAVALKAEVAIGEVLTPDGVATLTVRIERVKEGSTGETKPVAGGIGTHKFTVSYSGTELEVLNATSAFPFSATTNIRNEPVGQTSVLAVSATGSSQPPLITAQLVLRIKAKAGSPATLSVRSDSIVDAQKGEEVSPEGVVSYTVVRGDVQKVTTGSGTVTTADALYLAQHLVGLRTTSEINLINAASIRPDDATGDKITTADLLFLTQYLVGLRDQSFDPVQ